VYHARSFSINDRSQYSSQCHPQVAELSNGAVIADAERLPQLKWKSILLSEQKQPVAMIMFAHQICVKVRKTPR
jgi:hypothetical protein